MTNEDTHDWIEIDDGQTVKRCKCGTVQHDDGSVTSPDGSTWDGYFPKCDRGTGLRVRSIFSCVTNQSGDGIPRNSQIRQCQNA